MPRHYTSGDWRVKAGHEPAFLAAFAASGVDDTDPPLGGLVVRPRLLRDVTDPQRFLSFAIWDSREAIEQFRSRPDFKAMIDAMRAHLDAMQISTLEWVLGPDE